MTRKNKKPKPETAASTIAEATREHGWFQHKLWLIESMLHGRWSYWLAMLTNRQLGPLPEWAIPQISFSSIECGPEQPCFASNTPPYFDEPRPASILEEVGTRSQARKDCERTYRECFADGVHLSDCIAWWLWAFGSPRITERPMLSERAERALWQSRLHMLIAHPGDWAAYIATLYFGDRGGRHAAWFPTPTSLGTLTSQMLFELDTEDTRAKSVHDPCVGTGALLLPASNYSLNLSGQDIDRTMCLLCEWQGWLFMPWLIFGSKSAIKEIRDRNRSQTEHCGLIVDSGNRMISADRAKKIKRPGRLIPA